MIPPTTPQKPTRRVTARSKPPPPSFNNNNPKNITDDELATELSSLKITTSTSTRTPLKGSTSSRRAPPIASTSSVKLPPTSKPPIAARGRVPLSSRAAAPTSRTAKQPVLVFDTVEEEEDDRSPVQKAADAKRTINSSLSSLSTLSKSGWCAAKTAGDSESKEKAAATKFVNEGSKALECLRRLIMEEEVPGSVADVEKAAVSMVASLVEMGLYQLAIPQLALMRASILALWLPPTSPTPPPSTSSAHKYLFFPSPPPSYLAPSTLAAAISRKTVHRETLIPLILATQQYLLGSIFRSTPLHGVEDTRIEDVEKVLTSAEGPLEWRKCLGEKVDAMVEKKVDAMMVSMFGTLTNACVGADDSHTPTTLLRLRLYSLKVLATTNISSAKLVSLYDHFRKVLLLYGRAAEKRGSSNTEIAVVLVEAFDEVRLVLEAGGNVVASTKEAKEKWVELYEVVCYVARRGNDLVTVERVAKLMDPSGGPTLSSEDGVETSGDPAAQISALSARLAAHQTTLEEYFEQKDVKKDQDLSEDCRRAIVLVRNLTYLKSKDKKGKVDKVIKTLRFNLIKGIRKGGRLDSLLTLEAAEGNEKAVLGLLEAVVGPSEEALKLGVSMDDPIVSGGVDALLVLAYRHFHYQNRATYNPTFAFLDRSLTLLGATLSSTSFLTTIPFSSSTHIAICALSSTCANIGASLFNNGKAGDAIRFLRRSRELGAFVTNFAMEDDTSEGVQESREYLKKGLSRRSETLAMAYQATGDKLAALDMYISAVVEQPDTTFLAIASASPASLNKDKEHSPLFKLVQRVTRIAIFDLFRPAALVSLQTILAGRPADQIAAVLEMQIMALEGTLQKKEARDVFAFLLETLLHIYDRTLFPLRRARILLRQMQIHSSLETLTLDLSIEAAAAEIDDLCSADAPTGQDGVLRPFAQQYLAFSHLWLAFHAHQTSQLVASETTFVEAKSALRIIRSALDSDMVPSPSAPKRSPPRRADTTAKGKGKERAKEPVAAPSVATRRRLPVTAPPNKTSSTLFKTPQVKRTLPGSKAPPAIEPVTPPSKTLLDHGDGAPTLKRVDPETLALDDVEKCFAELETMAHLLGALGFSLLRISYLQFLRRLSSKIGPRSHAVFVTISALLGEEYVRLGKTTRAGTVFAQADSRLQYCVKAGHLVTPSARTAYLIAYTAYLATIGNHERSHQAYMDALEIADTCVNDEVEASGLFKIVERTLLLQRAAGAAFTCSIMIQRRGDLTRSIAPALQAVRVWSRAFQNLKRVSTQESDKPSPPSVDVFSVTDSTEPNAPLADFPPSPRKRQHSAKSLDPHAGLAWQVAERLVSSVLRVATLYAVQGTSKSAEHYAKGALELATEIGSPRLAARCLAVRVEVRLRWGLLDEAQADLDQMDTFLSDTSCPETVEAQRLRADLHLRRRCALEAHQGYSEAQQALAAFALSAEGEPGHSPSKHLSPARPVLKFGSPAGVSPRSTEKQVALARDTVLPAIHAYLLRVQVLLLRMQNKHTEGGALLQQLAKFGMNEEDKAEEFKLVASIRLQELLARFASDPILGMLSESVLSIPALSVPLAKVDSPRARGSSLLSNLLEVEKLLGRAVMLSVSRTEPAKLRELSLLTVAIRAFQSTTGKQSKRAAAGVANLLDLGLAVTLKREMVEAIDFKLQDRALHDDLVWPTPESSPTALTRPNNNVELGYWSGIRDRYRLESAEASLVDPNFSTILPSHWTVVSLHLTPERDALLLTRHRYASEPVVFKLPLDRVARREGEDESFTYDIAIEELRDIVKLSNAGITRAKDVNTKEEKVTWWTERKELDERLKTLTESIEVNWLGAFKTIFLDSRQFPVEAMATFKAQVERILRTGIVRTQEKKNVRFKLDDAILGCLAALSPKAHDEELEDLFCFILESFQFTGVPVGYDEQDEDQIICDLRTVLEELHAAKPRPPQPNSTSSPTTAPREDEHIFLLLDKSLQAFPWESIPSLLGQSVSRLPSLSFLRDRIDLASLRSSTSPIEHDSESESSLSTTSTTHEIVVDASRTSVVLNAGGDLTSTQETFEPWIERMKKSYNWSSIIGRKPSEEEMRSFLRDKDLFLYFGHGGAEPFIRSTTIRHLPRCATTMLWGCSSGYLKDQGDFDPVGTPNHYMIAGCPALVANLWDVTDKDIDKFSETVFNKLGFNVNLSSSSSSPSSTTITLAEAVGSSRGVCKLKYLNGAAPVVYGVPVKFKV